jgi:hypothetical protein
MKQHAGMVLTFAIGLLMGCGKDAPIPSVFLPGDSTTICKLLKVSVVFKTLPEYDYTIDFKIKARGGWTRRSLITGIPK